MKMAALGKEIGADIPFVFIKKWLLLVVLVKN